MEAWAKALEQGFWTCSDNGEYELAWLDKPECLGDRLTQAELKKL